MFFLCRKHFSIPSTYHLSARKSFSAVIELNVKLSNLMLTDTEFRIHILVIAYEPLEQMILY